MASCHECLKLVTDLIACRLLFREFFLQPVYAIDARTDLLKRRGIVCIRPQPASRYQSRSRTQVLQRGAIRADTGADCSTAASSMRIPTIAAGVSD
jgi:hypothetical protein